MDQKLKALVEAISHKDTQKIVQTHVKELNFDEEAQHLIIIVDNAGPLHELESKAGDQHLNKALAKVYGEEITYELRLPGKGTHERDKVVSRRVQW